MPCSSRGSSRTSNSVQHEYYNSEVKQLLGDRTSNDMVTELLQQMPWALQPLPEEYVHNSTESNKRQAVSVPVEKRKSRRAQAQYDANQVEAQTA